MKSKQELILLKSALRLKKLLIDKNNDLLKLNKDQDKRIFYLKHDMYRMNQTIETLQSQINFDLLTNLKRIKKEKNMLNDLALNS